MGLAAARRLRSPALAVCLATALASLMAGCTSLLATGGSVSAPLSAATEAATREAATDVGAADDAPEWLRGDHFLPDAAYRPDATRLPPAIRPKADRFRWAHAATPDDVPDEELRRLAAISENALILLGLRGQPCDRERLAAIARSDRPLTTRQAAAAAWTEATRAIATAESDWAAVARGAADGSLPLEVRGELVAGLDVTPQRVPTLTVACSPDDPLAAYAVAACLRFACSHESTPADYPNALASLRRHRDATVRIRVARWAALVGHPLAERFLRDQQRDVDPRVRSEAVVSAGWIPEASDLIDQARESASESLRAAAVVATLIADPDADPRGFDDEAASVRQTVARLTRDPTHLAKLIVDPDREVQRAALRTARDRPESDGVLRAALVGGTLETRTAAAALLRKRGSPLAGYDPRAAADERAAAVSQLRNRQPIASTRPARATSSEPNDEAVGFAIEALLANPNDAEAWAVLRTMTVADLPMLERRLHAEPLGQIDWPELWDELLPTIRGDFAAAAGLESRDPQARVDAAWRLVAWSQTRSLSPLLIRRLAAVLRHEQNAAVWRAVVEATAHESGPAVDGLFADALRSRWDDVRIIACRYVARGGSPMLAPHLRPLLVDASEPVRLAAIEAAGRSGHPALIAGDADSPGLRSLRTDPSREIRDAATQALFRLGDADATADLLRQLHASDHTARLGAVRTLAERPDEALVDAVVSIAWTERDARVRSELLMLLAAIDPDAADWPERWSDEKKLESYLAERDSRSAVGR